MKISRIQRRKARILALAWVLGAAGCMGTVQAEDRALLIGVGKYQRAGANLPGIDLDIDMMKDVAQRMGFSNRQVKVLMDEQATLKRVNRAMQDWLVKGVSVNDRVLIYYSGHGARIPDENGDEHEDKADEVLTMHDLAPVTRDGRKTLEGVLVDDEFNRVLERIKSRNVLVLVDACHSGSSTKSFNFNSLQTGVGEGYEKFFAYAGMPGGTKGFTAQEKRRQGDTPDNYVAIGAAQDDEKSIATPRGSLFTLGVKKAVNRASQEGSALTPKALTEQVARYVADKVGDSPRVFHPQLSGNEKLAHKRLRIRRVSDGHGPTWRRLAALVSSIPELSIQPDKETYREGDKLHLEIKVPRDGYLNVINVDAKDKPIVIFPNRFHPENRVKAGTRQVPGDMNFDLPAGAPFGPTLILALFSDRPVNLFKDGEGLRNDKGDMQDYFPELSEKSTRGFMVRAKKKEVKGGMVTVRILR